MTETTQNDKLQNIFVICTTIVVILFLLAVFFGVKYYHQPKPTETKNYGAFKFIKQDVIWYMNWQRAGNTYKIGLKYTPDETEDIPIVGELNNSFNKKNKIYIAFDPFSGNKSFKYLAHAASELTTQLTGPLGREAVAACTRGEQTDACKERPVVTCDNKELNIIILKEAEPTHIKLSGTCIIIQGKENELLRALEKALYTWFGIIKNPIIPVPPELANE
ncbi:hypothetical protein HY485_02265 [Candidatus Woesearchaeota archaeon]|nr:hypothetical protein [Candidatus Woesearchaeota archaeon]